MHLSGIRWDRDFTEVGNYSGLDLHVLRNSQPTNSLANFVLCQFALDPGDPATTNTNSQFLRDVLTIPSLRALIDQRPPKPGDPPIAALVAFAPHFGSFEAAHGITIAPDGAVTAQPNPAKKVDNLLIRVSVTRASPTPFDLPFDPYVILIRVHLHDALDVPTLQLTPAGLTVRQGGEPIRFGIVGEFTDSVAADLTYHRPRWRLFTGAGGVLTEVPASSGVCTFEGLTLDANTGGLRATGPFRDMAFVTAELPDFNNVQTPTQPVLAGPHWNTQVNAQWMGGAGIARRDEVVNVIVLSDGFQLADETKFFELVRQMVGDLSTRRVSG